MKHLLLATLLASFSSALADTPAKIAEDYRKASAAALVKVNDTLEKATVPLIAALVKSGDTAGADELREQLKAKTDGEPVPKPQASAANMFKLYDAARVKALEPAGKSAVARIDAMLNSSEGSKLETVAELGKVRAEVEAGKVVPVAMPAMPAEWTYHATERPDGSVGPIHGELHFHPDGTVTLYDRSKGNAQSPGRWKANPKGNKVSMTIEGYAEWKMEIHGTTATLDRPDEGLRYMRVKPPKA